MTCTYSEDGPCMTYFFVYSHHVLRAKKFLDQVGVLIRLFCLYIRNLNDSGIFLVG